MTDSWRPSPGVLHEIETSLPHSHPLALLPQFADYYQEGEHAGVVKTQEQWDRKFRAWCSRAETRWLDEHDEDVTEEVRWDSFTGMPLNPRKPIYADQVSPDERERS